MESNGDVRGVVALFCDPLTIPDPGTFPKWQGISLVNDVKFKAEEIKVRRAHGVGKR